MSALHGMFSLGGMAGAAATGAIAAAGVPLAAAFLGVGALVAVLAVAACRPMLSPRPRGGAGGPGFARPPRALLPPGLMAFTVLLAEGAIADWSAVYLSNGLGAGTTMAAAAFAAFSLAMAAGRFCGDRLVGSSVAIWSCGRRRARRSRPRPDAVIGASLVAVLGFGLVGAGLSCVFPVVLSSAARTPGLPPSAAIAAVCTVGYFGFLLGPPAIGGLAELIGLPGSARPGGAALRPDRGARQPGADRARRAAVSTSA